MKHFYSALTSILLLILTINGAFGAGTYVKGPALIEGTTSTVTAAGTTTLTKDSETLQQFTGATTQTVTLPNATTIPNGRKFYFFNRSTGAVTINYFGGSLAQSLTAGQWVIATLYSNGTSAGTWDFAFSPGVVSTAITALTGDVTATGPGSVAATIPAGTINNTRMSNVPTATFKGRVTSGTGTPEDLTGTQATTLLDTFTSGLKGLAPASGGGTANFLRADGSWSAPGAAAGFSIGGPISSGTANHVIYEDAANTIAEDTDLQFDGDSLQLGKKLVMAKISTPSNPPAGYVALYPKSDDNFYKLTSGGVETAISGGGGGLTIGGSITGGTANRVLYESSGNLLAESANLQFDGVFLGTTQLSVGSAGTTPNFEMQVFGGAGNSTAQFTNNTTGNTSSNGTLLEQVGYDFKIKNQESANIGDMFFDVSGNPGNRHFKFLNGSIGLYIQTVGNFQTNITTNNGGQVAGFQLLDNTVFGNESIVGVIGHMISNSGANRFLGADRLGVSSPFVRAFPFYGALIGTAGMRIGESATGGTTTTEPNYELEINGNAGDSITQFINTATGLTSSDGTKVGLDSSGNFEINQQESALTFALKNAKGVQVQGTNTNDSAAASYVGEYTSAAVAQGSAVSLTTATPATITSVSLTAGDWDVSGVFCLTGTLTGTQFLGAIGETTNSLTGTVLGDTRIDTPTVSLAGSDVCIALPAVRKSLSATTTVYLLEQTTFTVGTASGYGRISARRAR